MGRGNVMKSKVICFASAKGGSGKTIISASIAKLLAALEKKILVIDMDAATNGLSLLFLDELVTAKKYFVENDITPHGIFETTDVELPNPFSITDSFEIIPAVYEIKQTENISEENFKKFLSKTLDAYKENYDYIYTRRPSGHRYLLSNSH